MSPAVIVIVLISTVLHASWNLLGRRQRNEVAFFRRMLIVVAVAGLVPAATSEILTRSLTPRAWMCVIGSGICIGIYFYALAHAYAGADFTVVYPVARALPVLFVALADLLRGRPVTPFGWLGMALVMGGCFLAPLHSFGEFRLSRYVHRAGIWMVVAALGTTGYSILDKIAAEAVERAPATAARYGYVQYLVACILYFVLYHHRDRAGTRDRRAVGWLYPAIGAGCTFCGYWLILWAFQLSRHASYIVAFRQFSIVLGVVFAFVLYREGGRLVRITATLLITAGLICIGVWGREEPSSPSADAGGRVGEAVRVPMAPSGFRSARLPRQAARR